MSALAAGLDRPVDPAAAALAARVAAALGAGTAAVLHYGSRAQGSGAEPDSAWDFVVVVDDPPAAWRALARSGASTATPALATLLHPLLPPTVVAVRPPDLPGRPLAKCVVLTARELARGCSPGARDHFLLGRLFQDVRLAWARDPGGRAAIESAVAAARAHTFAWVRPWLPPRFGAADYLRALLAVSYAGEVRPETHGRIEVLAAAQGPALLPILTGMLDSLADRGAIARDGDGWRLLDAPRFAERARWRLYFLGSKLRITLRWPKHVLLYDGWLDYVVRKIERRSGVRLVLSPLERRWPLVFLWPRALHYLVLHRPRTRA